MAVIAGIGQASDNDQDRLVKLIEFLTTVGDGLKVVNGERIWQVTCSAPASLRVCLIVRIKKWLLRGCRMIKCNDALYLMAKRCT